MQTVVDLLKRKKFLYSAELIPPRNGSDISTLQSQIEELKKANIDFLSVTKGAGGALRGGTLPIAAILQNEYKIPSVAHFTCRDLDVDQIENHLIDHHYLGIQNILALRGDPPDGLEDPFQKERGPLFYQFAYQLVKQIADLNLGTYRIRHNFDQNARQGSPTKFCIGVATYPEEPMGVDYLKIKADNGAQFAITQMLYSESIYKNHVEACKKNQINLPIFPGFRIITNYKTAIRIQNKFKIHVPSELIDGLKCREPDPSEASEFGFQWSLNLARRYRDQGAPGLHIFVMNDAAPARRMIELLRLES